MIGGRKALENRCFIKHLMSEQESTGFKHDLSMAISRILGDKKSLEDKNKGKRNVIKHQTQETKYSLAESISRAKVEDRLLYQILIYDNSQGWVARVQGVGECEQRMPFCYGLFRADSFILEIDIPRSTTFIPFC